MKIQFETLKMEILIIRSKKLSKNYDIFCVMRDSKRVKFGNLVKNKTQIESKLKRHEHFRT